jgi:RNA polymerase sigma-70 factor (ECF subfamily)
VRQLGDSLDEVAPQDLADRIRAGDKRAETELVRRYSRSIMALLRHRTGNVQQAEDLHQDTFFVVLQRLRTTGIDDPTRVSAFLHQTAINLLIGNSRRDARRKTQPDLDLIDVQPDTRADQLRALIRAEADGAIRAMIQELSTPRDRELLYRFYILQQEKSLICKAMTLSVERFDRVISRARKRFRELIDRKGPSADLLEGER